MIRVVALKKAVIAGLCGAAVMEIFSLATRRAGFASVDLITELGSVNFDHLPIVANVAAVLAHLSVGVAWAVFYAFFFWGRFHFRPAIQGLLFAILPATLAILVVYPELALMHLPAHSVRL